MNGYFDIYTLAFMILAVVIFVRLRSVLGRRTGNERPPVDTLARRQADRPADASDKVVELPGASSRPPPAAVGGTQADGVAAIAAAQGGFDADEFLTGAGRAYEMVVTAYAEGDRETLNNLLSREVYDGFVAAIGEREQRGEKIDFKFVGIDKAEITEAHMKGGMAQVTVRFVSSLVSVTRGSDQQVIEGDPNHVSEVTDIWTFARDVTSRDPNWRLVATESVD